MGEISRIDGAYVKGIYYKELFQQATLTPEQYRQAMTQASREMKSDYELAQLLISIADRLPSDEISRDAYFTAAVRISSDYELRRVYSTMLKRGPVSAADARGHPDALGHDRLRLRAVGAAAPDPVAADARRSQPRRPSSRTVATIDSDYERHRVLSAVVDRSPDAATSRPRSTQAASLSSDYEAGTFLHEVLAQERRRGSGARAVLQGREPHGAPATRKAACSRRSSRSPASATTRSAKCSGRRAG